MGFKRFFIAIPLLALATSVYSHGEADWIREGGYLGTDNNLCCGEHDCFKIKAEYVKEEQGGFRIIEGDGKGEFIKFDESQKSKDGYYWRCKYPSGKTRCFFYPPTSS